VEAKTYLQLVRDWVTKKRAINITHELMVLDAEMMTLGTRKSAKNTDPEIMAAFDKAICSVAKIGFFQDAALAAHLASRAVKNKESAHGLLAASSSLIPNVGCSRGDCTSGKSFADLPGIYANKPLRRHCPAERDVPSESETL
jgi:hypothetical protein